MTIAIIIFSFIILGVMLAFVSNSRLKSYFEKLNLIPAQINITSIEVLVCFITNLNLDIKISENTNNDNPLNNSYHIKEKVIFLSSDVFASSSVASISIAMHELGHAIQHNNKSKIFYLYYVLSILNKITSILLLPLIIFLIISLFLPTFYLKLALILIGIFYILNLLIRIVIIPLEKNASKIALKLLLQYQILDKKELKKSKKLLNLALTTYIGGFFINYIRIFNKIIRNF